MCNKFGNWPTEDNVINNYNISTIYCNKDFLLQEESESDTTNDIQKAYKCPEIPVYLNNCPLNALVDTGANISCLSELWFQENKAHLGEYCELPVTSVHIKTAVGEKSKRVSRIIYIKMKILDQSTNVQLIIVPNLVRPLIFGIDMISQLKMKLNFDDNYYKIKINNKDIILKFGQVQEEGIVCHLINESCINKEKYYERENWNNKQNTMNNTQEQLTLADITESLKDNTLMNEEQRHQLTDLLWNYRQTFSDQPGRCNKYQHILKVDNPQNFKYSSYPVPVIHQQAVMEEIERMVKMDVIERSNSTYINPIIPVVKKSGEIRLCLDARKANQIIVPDYECNRSVNELLSKCKNSKWLSSIDLSASYWQIPLSEESRQYTAFQFRGKTYHFKVTPFGISTSQAALVRALDNVFDESVENFTIIYIDDICVISPTFERHLENLNYIFQKLTEANMTVKFSKSTFCKNSIPFLGYTLTESGLQMDNSKVQPILDFPSPKNRRQLKSFLGCINYYNKFLSKYSETIQPLLRLTSKKNKFIWTTKDEETFSQIKQLFLRVNVLHHADHSQVFYIQTDASDNAIGGHLFQIRDNGEKAAIAFMSRALRPVEQRFTTTEKELLAIIHCLQKTRHIILGAKLKILTDNHALTFLKTCKLLNNRLTRWILAIQEYDFEIEHCKGSENQTADALSRIPYQNINPSESASQELFISYISRIQDPQLKNELKNLPQLQANDPQLQVPYNILSNPKSPEYENMSQIYKIHNNILYKKYQDTWLITIPESIILRLIWECHHYYLHCGPKKCFTILRESFTFKNMGRRIRTTLAKCDSCQRCKSNPHPSIGISSGITCNNKNEHIAVDVIGPLPRSIGNVKFIFIILDIFTKFVKLYPIRSANTKTLINKAFGSYFNEFGIPQKVQSDNGTQFKSKAWIKKLEEYNIIPIFSPLYYPRFNMAERPIKEVKRCLRTYCSQQQQNWSRCLPIINDFLNEVQHDTTGFTPNELQFNKKDTRFWEKYLTNPFIPEVPYDRKLQIAANRIRTKQEKRAQKTNSKNQYTTFQLDDLVLIKTHPLSNAVQGETAKLFELYEGPFKICKIIGRNVYHVCTLDGRKQFGPYHVSAMKLYHH